MIDRVTGAERRDGNPLFNSNRLKLGIFGLNVSNGCAITTAEGHLEADWPTMQRIVTTGDAAGFEAMVPVARWKGFGGVTNFNGSCYETYTWAAGMAAATQHAAIFATSHVPVVHPIMAAKQATTIDHISGGRFALNVVGGWYTPELEMFGAPLLDHDSLYAYAAEWLDVARLLWTREDEWDYEGRFFTIRKGFHEPKPIQQPFPPIMNAGGSVTGRRFAAKYADMVFIGLGGGDLDETRAQIEALRNMAREEFGRTIQVWTSAYAICRPTEREARDYFRYYTEERGDREAVENLVRVRINQPDRVSPEDLETMKSRMIAGWGGYPLIGTPEQIVDRLVQLSQAGLDGLVLSWVKYQVELEQWIAEVLPLMEQADLRAPFRPHSARP